MRLLVSRAARALACATAVVLATPTRGAAQERLDAGAVAWLKAAAVPFDRATAGGDHADLAPLGAMIGDARVVGLGEGTHGTREFFQMKHRVLEYLVRERGFTAFAIEATMPEAEAVDAYVRGGEGDPAVLLSNLYFWTWNTQEVLDMILWMRTYNRGVPPERQLRFFGFDMQFPGTAMDTVRAYVQRVDAPKATFVDSSYACLAPYRNRGRAAAPAQYATLAVLPRSLCRASIAAVAGMLDGGRARYEPLGEDAFARARQSARLVAQWEDMSQAPPARRSALRDFYMAENARWQLERLPAGAKMVVWAHNAHVANATEMMGKHLRTALGPSYVAVGFAFGRGSFNAVAAPTSGSSGRGLRAHSTSHVPEGSFDDYFRAVGMPRFIVDARRIASSPAAAPLASPLKLRSIGAMFAPGREHLYFYPVQLPREYDLLIYFDRATESTLLPFRAG